MSGLPAPPDIEGVNFTDVIKGKKSGIRESLFTAYRHTIRAVRTKEWKLIRYPERNFTQIFNLKNDPLELHNLAGKSEISHHEAELTTLLKKWQSMSDDTLSWTAAKVLPMSYDPASLKQKPDVHQPDYILKKYFR